MALTLVAVMIAALPRWNAPPGCPGADALAQRIEQLTGRVPQEDELHSDVAIAGPPWRATIELGKGGVVERRVVEADACTGLLDAAAIVIAVAMDPVLVIRRHERVMKPTRAERSTVPETPIDDPAPSAETEPSTTGVVPPASPSPNRSPRTIRHGLGIRAGADVGIGGWDRAAGGVELALAWSRNALSLELVGRYWIPRRDALPDRGAVRIELGTVGAQACWIGGRQRCSFAACGGIEGGDFVVDGAAAPATARVHFPWVAPLVGGRVGFRPRGPLVLFLGLEAAVPVTRLRGSLRAAEPIIVYDAGVPAVRASGGIELRWTLAPRSRP